MCSLLVWTGKLWQSIMDVIWALILMLVMTAMFFPCILRLDPFKKLPEYESIQTSPLSVPQEVWRLSAAKRNRCDNIINVGMIIKPFSQCLLEVMYLMPFTQKRFSHLIRLTSSDSEEMFHIMIRNIWAEKGSYQPGWTNAAPAEGLQLLASHVWKGNLLQPASSPLHL